MDRQKTFDKVAHHLLTQGEVALRPGTGNCAYKTSRGLRCAIGCLIPDGHPSLEFDGALRSLLNEYPDLVQTFGISGTDDRTFLKDLQIVHDGRDVKGWRCLLIKHANEWGLKDKVPKGFPVPTARSASDR